MEHPEDPIDTHPDFQPEPGFFDDPGDDGDEDAPPEPAPGDDDEG